MCLWPVAVYPDCHAGQSQPSVLDGELEPIDHVFFEKQVIAVTVPSGFLYGGGEAMLSSHCEVYASYGMMTPVCSDTAAAQLTAAGCVPVPGRRQARGRGGRRGRADGVAVHVQLLPLAGRGSAPVLPLDD